MHPKIKVLILSISEFQASGTQNIFYSDQDVLHISIHKENTNNPSSGIEKVH